MRITLWAYDLDIRFVVFVVAVLALVHIGRVQMFSPQVPIVPTAFGAHSQSESDIDLLTVLVVASLLLLMTMGSLSVDGDLADEAAVWAALLEDGFWLPEAET